MPDTLLHCCLTCAHYRWDGNPFLGWCAHEERQPSTDLVPLVRWRELPCRYDFSKDLWVSRDGDDGTRIVGLRTWGPFPEDCALDDLPADLLAWLAPSGD